MFDLMVIDVDGNDYWLWEVLGRAFSPRVVCIEYKCKLARPTPRVDHAVRPGSRP